MSLSMEEPKDLDCFDIFEPLYLLLKTRTIDAPDTLANSLKRHLLLCYPRNTSLPAASKTLQAVVANLIRTTASQETYQKGKRAAQNVSHYWYNCPALILEAENGGVASCYELLKELQPGPTVDTLGITHSRTRIVVVENIDALLLGISTWSGDADGKSSLVSFQDVGASSEQRSLLQRSLSSAAKVVLQFIWQLLALTSFQAEDAQTKTNRKMFLILTCSERSVQQLKVLLKNHVSKYSSSEIYVREYHPLTQKRKKRLLYHCVKDLVNCQFPAVQKEGEQVISSKDLHELLHAIVDELTPWFQGFSEVEITSCLQAARALSKQKMVSGSSLTLVQHRTHIVAVFSSVFSLIPLPGKMGLQVSSLKPKARQNKHQLSLHFQSSSFKGYEKVIARLHEAFQLYHEVLHSEVETPLGKALKLSPFRGLLITGQSGSGKSLLLDELGKHLKSVGFTVIIASPSEIVSKYMGESEAALRALFSRARSTFPSAIVFDDLHVLMSGSSSQNVLSGLSHRLTTTLLNELDGIGGPGANHSSFPVLFLTSVAEKSMLAPSLLRPGRLDLQIELEPASASSALQIISAQLEVVKCWTADPQQNKLLKKFIDNDIFAKHPFTDWTPAALKQIVSEGCRISLRRRIASRQSIPPQVTGLIDKELAFGIEDLKAALYSLHPV